MTFLVTASTGGNTSSSRHCKTLGEAQQTLAAWLYGTTRPGIYAFTLHNEAGILLEEFRLIAQEDETSEFPLLITHIKRYTYA